uniref:TFIIH basal transcription factor subunit n=1 Tax=Trypanosoma congolense (strain IL3000) TaxID=1068625 RepID=G0UIU4_TRYCI|nr:conserved hypothetical protein [Trypanosoma congolense IL3000]
MPSFSFFTLHCFLPLGRTFALKLGVLLIGQMVAQFAMSQLSEILNTAQLTKYYELIQFLSSHVNTEYTLAQLDYLLPRGASLQRFPAQWKEFMEDGRCNNQNIQVYRRPVQRAVATATTSAGDGAAAQDAAGLEELVFICRRPEVKDQAQLATLLQSPVTMPDAEGCVALHTEQVIINEGILKSSQAQGLLYYFPDAYTKSREHIGSKSRRHIGLSGVSSGLFRGEDTEDDLGSGTDGKLNLPADVSAQFMHYTRRGVPLRGKNTFPMRFNVGERAMIILERSASPDSASPAPKPPVVVTSLGRPTGLCGGSSSEAVMPVELRVKASANSVGSKRTFMDVRAEARGKVVLSLFVDEKETIIPLEVVDDNATMPGVMIGRDRQPPLQLPDSIRINDSAIWGTAGSTGRGCEERTAVARGAVSSVVPWWSNPSPSILEVRDLTIPDSETFAAASRAVWLVHKADESAMRAVRATLREQYSAETAQRKRNKRSRMKDLRNSHMIHYGFDASVPFSGDV